MSPIIIIEYNKETTGHDNNTTMHLLLTGKNNKISFSFLIIDLPGCNSENGYNKLIIMIEFDSKIRFYNIRINLHINK